MPTCEARQSPTRNTLVCASRTNNTYTFPALPKNPLSGWYITKISLSTRTFLVVRTYMRTPPLSGTNSAFLLALQQVLLTLPPLAIPRPPPSLKSHRWLVNVYDLELVVHSFCAWRRTTACASSV